MLWPMGINRTEYNSSRIAIFDEMGNFLSSDKLQFSANDMGLGPKRRLTIDYDGNLRLYSLINAAGCWGVTWEALIQRCRVHGICGRNAICVYTPEPKCSCPPGYEVSNKGNWNEGCKPKFNLTCSQPVKFVEIRNLDFYGFDLKYIESTTFHHCKKLCLDDCRCQAFRYKLAGKSITLCYTKGALFNGHKSPNQPGGMYLKLPVSVETSVPTNLSVSDSCMNNETKAVRLGSALMYHKPRKGVRWVYLYSFVSAVGAVEFLFIVSGWSLLFRRHGAVAPSLQDEFRRISSHFRMYLYSELKKTTQNFKEEVGRGASGAVYKGVLEDKRVVAVKKLADIYHAEDVFWAEVTTIGKIHHMNLVRTWGFCSENKHRLLICEYI